MSKKNSASAGPPPRLIAQNKKARHDYSIEQTFEAGMVLEGWEVKSIRAGRVQLKESYITLRKGEVWLLGAHISPLPNVAEYINPDSTRSRKLLLNQKEISRLQDGKEREGYTIVPLDLHWTRNRIKAVIALAKGKKQYDKRETSKRRDWEREKQRLLKR